MTPLDQRLITLRRAVLACRDTPGRVGRVVHLADADDVFITGDVHGHADNLRRLFQRADLVSHPRRHFVVQEIVHGPFRYAGGGDRSHQVVEMAMALMVQFPGRVHYLMGNHELSQLTRRPITKEDYGDINEHYLTGLRTAYGERADDVYALHAKLFECAPLAVRTPGRLLIAHTVPPATFDPAVLELDATSAEDLDYGGSVYGLVWGRDVSPELLDGFLAKMDADWFVSGHIPNDDGFQRPSPRHLILDSKGHPCGAALLPAGAIDDNTFSTCHVLL